MSIRMKLTDRSLTDLLSAFRSSDPTPGGGSASALAGALGASLLTMVAAIPKPVAASEADLQRLTAAGAACRDLASRLEDLVDADAQAYDRVMSAYRLPKGTDGEKAARASAIQDAVRGATETPLQVMRLCAEAAGHAADVAALSNRNASSDVLVGLELLAAGLRGARLNVEINLPGLKDAEYVAGVRSEAGRLLEECERRAAEARRIGQ
jgi:formiminotetrahydrofolate cyclodeaminase